jgi:hypothetical protein
MTVTINGTTGISIPTQFDTASTFGFKNRIINGAMVIDQRNAGASVTPTTTNTYVLDRWLTSLSASSKYSVQQNAGSVTPPTGYINYLGCTSLSAYTVGAAENFCIQQKIEGLNVADLAWGTASAATVTLSFWVYSSLTGTFGGSVRNNNQTRAYPFTYTISSANTWTQASVTIAGDTTGTWLTTNGTGINVVFSLGTGSTLSGTAGAWAATNYNSATGAVSVVGTNGATWYITGVQLEKGSTATSFDYRPYGTELMLCQRYYYKTGLTAFSPLFTGSCQSTTGARGILQLPVPTRTAPTSITVGGSAPSISTGVYTSATFDRSSTNAILIAVAGTGFTSGGGLFIYGNTDATTYIDIGGAEL